MLKVGHWLSVWITLVKKDEIMNCPKCKSENVSEGTAGTLHCDGCDYSWVAGGTAPRWLDAGVQKPAASNPASLVLLIIMVVLIAVALGFASPLWGVLVGIFGLLAAILVQLSRLSTK